MTKNKVKKTGVQKTNMMLTDAQNTNKGIIVIFVTSAGFKGGNMAKITINDVPVIVEPNDSKND